MSDFIITAIIALATAEAKTQAKDDWIKSKCREKSEGKRRVANKRMVH
jgi:hypothetical protein